MPPATDEGKGLAAQETIRDAYERDAERYEAYWREIQRYERRVARFLALAARPDSRVLDVGCGPGHLTRGLPGSVEVVGLDLAEAMVRAARKRRPSGRYVVHDYHRPVPRRLGRFDVVLAAGALDFCQELELVLGHLEAAMAGGARMLFTVAERRKGMPMHDRRLRRIATGRDMPGVRLAFHAKEEVRAILERLGLEVRAYAHQPGWYNEWYGLDVWYGCWDVARAR